MSPTDDDRSGGRGRSDLLAEAVDRIAHQIKNPLQAVAMNLEVIRMRVRDAAPELWSEIERYGEAVDENVSLLDRRVRLLLLLGRRSAGASPESVDVAGLVRDFSDALQLDDGPPAMSVRTEGVLRAARARPGFVLALALDVWLAARGASAEDGELPVTVAAGDEVVVLELRLPPDVAVSDARRSRWREAAGDAGGDLSTRRRGGTAVVRLELPAD